MDLYTYLNKRVQIVLIKGFTYIGIVVDCDENSITLIDKTNCQVCLKETSIEFIKEISNGY